MFATAVIAGLVGVWLCAAIVRAVALRLGLPIRETLMWFGLLELDGPALARAGEERRRPTRGATEAVPVTHGSPREARRGATARAAGGGVRP